MEPNEVKEIVETLRLRLGMTLTEKEIMDYFRAKECNDEIMELKSSLPPLARKRFFPWHDVIGSMLDKPARVSLTDEKCPECGNTLLQLSFSSPYWTWRDFCGRGGPMKICPHCPRQISFILTVMN